jgi:hypothetical protein
MFDDLKAQFFEGIIEPYQEYVRVRNTSESGLNKDLRNAIDVATALYHFREHFPQQQQKTRSQLAQICPDYDLLGDVVNASKHGNLTRGTPQITSAQDIYEEVRITQYEDQQGEYWGSAKDVVVELQDGSHRDLYTIITNVVNMWIDELHGIGIISDNQKFSVGNRDIPPRMSESGASTLDLRMLQGVRFKQRMRVQKYNYQTGQIEPVDLSGYNAKMRIYTPQYSVDVELKDQSTGDIVKKTINLTEEQSQEFFRLTDETEQQAFLAKLANDLNIFGEMAKDLQQNKKEGDNER